MRKINWLVILLFFWIGSADSVKATNDLDTISNDQVSVPFVEDSKDTTINSDDSLYEFKAIEANYPIQEESMLLPEIPDDVLPIIEDNFNTSKSIIGSDNRKQIKNTIVQPYSTSTLLVIKFPKGVTKVGSGNIIGTKYVLTAGHCLYNRELGGWANSIKIYPGYNGKTASLGMYHAVNMKSTSGWVQGNKTDHDIGLITLNANVSSKTGTLGLTTKIANKATITGYPAEKNGAMWSHRNNVSSSNLNNVYYDIDTTGGQSGSALYDDNKNAFAVHAYGSRLSTGPNHGTKINSEKLKLINEWMGNKEVAISFNKNITLSKENYTLWNDLKFSNKKDSTTGKLGKVYNAKVYYDHKNGAKYYSLYNNNGTWAGYVNANAVKILSGITLNKDVTISKENYTLWNNFFSSAKKGSTSEKLGKFYNAKYSYTLGNGVLYYSLYDNKGTWIGYLNANAANILSAKTLNKKVTISKENYTLWTNFFFTTKKSSTTGKKGKVYNAKYSYTLGNGVLYYSLYDTKEKWMGYLNANATSNTTRSLPTSIQNSFEESSTVESVESYEETREIDASDSEDSEVTNSAKNFDSSEVYNDLPISDSSEYAEIFESSETNTEVDSSVSSENN